jgi:hypothetical protein
MPKAPDSEGSGDGGPPAPSGAEIRERVAYESARRARFAVPAIAGGVLFLLGGIIVNSALHEFPTVGVIQGLAPALRGEAHPAVSPSAAELRFIDHHAFGFIAGNTLQALAVALLISILLFLLGTVRFRRPETSPAAQPLVLWGGAALVLATIVKPIAQVLNAHSFVTGHDLTAETAHRALTQGTVLQLMEYLALLGGLAFAVGVVMVALGATRTGIAARWTLYLGVFAALLAFTPLGLAFESIKGLIVAFWMVSLGILLGGRWPGGDPPAWAAGEARPWPSQARVRGEREAARSSSSDAPAPEPVQPAPRGGGRRRRKRGPSR